MANSDRYEVDDDEDFDELDNSQRLNASSRLFNYDPNYEMNYSTPPNLSLDLKRTNTSTFKSYNPMYESPESDEVTIRRYLGVSVQLVSLIAENLLAHPFIILRRQCQVHHNSKRYHLLPVTLVPVVIHLHRRQGVTTLWKGIGSSLLVRGMSLAVEDVCLIIIHLRT